MQVSPPDVLLHGHLIPLQADKSAPISGQNESFLPPAQCLTEEPALLCPSSWGRMTCIEDSDSFNLPASLHAPVTEGSAVHRTHSRRHSLAGESVHRLVPHLLPSIPIPMTSHSLLSLTH